MKTPLVIIGFGPQAKAWALNLRDSGREITIALRKDSTSEDHVRQLGFNVIWIESEEMKKYQVFVLLIPENEHRDFLLKNRHSFEEHSRIILSHGLSICKDSLDELFPHWEFSLLSPKTIASELRFHFETKQKIPAIYWAKEPQKWLLEIARDLGVTSVFPAHFKEETIAHLFSEQSLFATLIPYASLACYQKLREKNIPKEIAFLECFLELKSVTEAFVKIGPANFFNMIGTTGIVGAQKAHDYLIDEKFKSHLEHLLQDIISGKFYSELDQQDHDKIKKQIDSFWKNQELTQTFYELKDEIIL